MEYQSLKIDRRGASTWIWMNRPEVHNAFDETLIAELTSAFAALESEADSALHRQAAGNPEAREGLDAFLAKRAPAWTSAH